MSQILIFIRSGMRPSCLRRALSASSRVNSHSATTRKQRSDRMHSLDKRSRAICKCALHCRISIIICLDLKFWCLLCIFFSGGSRENSSLLVNRIISIWLWKPTAYKYVHYNNIICQHSHYKAHSRWHMLKTSPPCPLLHVVHKQVMSVFRSQAFPIAKHLNECWSINI